MFANWYAELNLTSLTTFPPVSAREGTGTQPDYLANHADQKNEGPIGLHEKR